MREIDVIRRGVRSRIDSETRARQHLDRQLAIMVAHGVNTGKVPDFTEKDSAPVRLSGAAAREFLQSKFSSTTG